jgi:pyruvate dehydrogenase E2 component (dihydrolipoamide acetyltransferase)
MTEVIMPKMGDGMEEGTLLEWLKKEGDVVKAGEVIGTIQTDKATLELEAPGSGTLAGLKIGPGGTVPVGATIAAILKDGESLPEAFGASAPATAAPAPAEGNTAGAPSPAIPAPEPSPAGARVIASPLARKIAAERGVDLTAIRGSGPGGRIIEKDVAAAVAPAIAQSAQANQGELSREVPLNRLRQITAQRTAQSKQQAPHFYVRVEVDVEAIQDLRDAFKAQEGGKVSVNDFVVRACALALREMPVVNSSFLNEKTILEHGAVHVGIAVAIEEGLTVPVIKNADALTLRQIAHRSAELAQKARENRLHPDELSGSTFSVSNMGMLDVDDFAAIINQPNAAILAVSTARKKVVVNEDGDLEVRARMSITGSFDHRVIDGAVGAKFVNFVREFLENPTRLLS